MAIVSCDEVTSEELIKLKVVLQSLNDTHFKNKVNKHVGITKFMHKIHFNVSHEI